MRGTNPLLKSKRGIGFRLKGTDCLLLAAIGVLACLSLIFVYSATDMGRSLGGVLTRHIYNLIVAFLVLGLFWLVDYEFWGRYHFVLYWMGIISLVAVLILGIEGGGARRWLYVPGLGMVQPSEVMKLVLVISLSRVLSEAKGEDLRGVDLVLFGKIALLMAPPLLLILVQPDLGTVAVIFLCGLGLLVVAGVDFTLILALSLVVFLAAPLGMKQYQRDRLVVFLHPEKDPTGIGWNLLQSQIAVGSGGIWGEGLFQGVRKQLKFVPERHTDFIFTVIGEETGLVGSGAVLLLYMFILWQAWGIAVQSADRFGMLLASGIAIMLTLHVLVNVGMVLGLAPITGLPLPWLSYGGSAMVTVAMMFGLLLSIGARRPSRWLRVTVGDPYD